MLPVVTRFRHAFAKIPLRWVVVVPFVLQTIVVMGLVGYLLYCSGRQTDEPLAAHLQTAIFCSLLLLVTTTLGVLTSRWLMQLILLLYQSSCALVQGDGQQPLPENLSIWALETLLIDLDECRCTPSTYKGYIDCKRAKEELYFNAELFRQIIENARDGLYVYSCESQKYIYTNAVYQALWGQDLELLSRHATRFQWIHPDDRSTVQAAYEQEKQGQSTDVEYRIIQTDRQMRWVRNRVYPIYSLQGHLTRLAGILEDITDRKNAEAALRQSEATNRALIQAIPDLFIQMDRYGKYLRVLNPGSIPLLNPTAILPGAMIFDVLPPHLAQQRMDYIQVALQTRKPQVYEYQIEVGGRIQYEEARITPCEDDTVLIIIRDVSERARLEAERQAAEDTIRKNAEQLRLLTDALPVFISYADTEQRYRFVNKTYETRFGRSREEICGQHTREVIGEVNYELVRGYIERALAGETVSYEVNVPSEPQEYSFSVILVPDVDATAQVQGYYSLVIDISDRKRAEEQLRAESDFRRAIESAIVEGIVIVDLEGRQNYVNPAFCRMVGWNAEELLGAMPPFVYWPPEEIDTITQALQCCLKGNRPPQGMELRFMRRNGERFDVLLLDAPLRNAQGEVTSWLGSVYDITERKQAEIALKQSEARYRAIVEDQTELISRFLPDTTLLFVNDAYCRYFGVRQEDIIGKSYNPVIYEDDRDRVTQLVQSMSVDNPTVTIENRVIVNGDIRWTQWVNRLLFDQQGNVIELQSVGRDITELKQAEEALRQSEERFRSAFRDASIGMAMIGLDDRWLKVNPILYRMLGYSESELLSMKVSTLIHPDDRNKFHQCIEQVLTNQNQNAQAELRYCCQGGRITWGLMSLSLVRDIQGQPLHYVAQIQDITEQQKIDQMKDEFISVVSHELRTPLTAIRGSLGILETGVLDNRPEKAKHMLQVALNNSDRLVRLVNDILNLERLESGKVQLVMETCRVVDLMQQAIEAVQEIAIQASITLHLMPLDTDRDAKIWAAPDAIVQTLTNLLSNAIKFSSPGFAVWLSVQWLEIQAATGAPSSVLFSIKDEGRGIPADKLESVFGRFQQVDVSDSRQKGGTGLGLAICKSIVQQHGGKIWAESSLGEGSTFYFTIPGNRG